MAPLFDILSAKLTGDIPEDAAITQRDIAAFEKRLSRVIPVEFAELLIAANGLIFEPTANFRGDEVLGFFSLWNIERRLETAGEFIPPFALPFAHSFALLFCLDRWGFVYTVSGIGDPIPRIIIEPTCLTLRMFCEELKPTA